MGCEPKKPPDLPTRETVNLLTPSLHSYGKSYESESGAQQQNRTAVSGDWLWPDRELWGGRHNLPGDNPRVKVHERRPGRGWLQSSATLSDSLH